MSEIQRRGLASANEASHGTVLVVDDHPLNRQLIVALLNYRGFHTVEAGDGVEALEAAQRERPALIIVDIVMPRMNGVEFVQHLRANPLFATVPVVFYTASYRFADAQRMAADCGVRHVIHKPAEPEDIFRAVDELLGLNNKPADPEFTAPCADSLRLAALTELTLDLTRETGVAPLLAKFACACRGMLGAREAGVALESAVSGQVCEFAVTSIAQDQAPARPPSVGWLHALVGTGRSCRLRDPDLAPDLLGLTPDLPVPCSLHD